MNYLELHAPHSTVDYPCKAVNTGEPIPPVQMPRGYGGTAIMWKHEIDHLIHVLQDGGNRIQCAELRGENPLLLISVYMPCRGLSDNVEDYNDCLDQLREILLKFSCSHSILLGGDMNEDMILRDQTIRAQLLKSFVKDNLLETVNTCQTYCNPDGVLISTLDYIFYSKDLTEKVVQHKGLENLQTSGILSNML